MEHRIRKIEKEELPRLVEMCESHAIYENAIYNPIGKQALLSALLFDKHPKLFCYVIEVNKNIAGYFSYTFDTSTWDAKSFLYLDCLYLEPEYRGQKIGDKVFEKLVAIAKENDCVNIQWQTPSFNETAIRFYKRIGATGKEKVRFFITV